MFHKKAQTWTIAVLMTVGILVADLLTPLGYAPWVLYSLTFWLISRHATPRQWALVVLSSVVLTAIGLFLSPPGGVSFVLAATQRSLGSLYLCVFAVLLNNRRKADAALQQSEERFRAIVEQSNAGFAVVDLTRRFVLVNDKFCSITGYSREELLRLQLLDITHPDDIPRSAELFDRIILEGRSFLDEKRYVRKDRSILWIETSVAVIHDASGRPTNALAIVIDISERKRAEATAARSQRLLQQIFESCPIGLVLTDTAGQFVKVNRAFAQIVGYEVEELEGRSYTQVITPENMVATAQKLAALNRGDELKPEQNFTLLRHDGTQRYADLTTIPLEVEDGQKRYFAAVTDVTDRKESAEQIEQLRNQLAHVSRLGTLGELASGLAHEMNQPLTALHLLSSAAMEIGARFESPELQTCLQKVQAQSLRAGEIMRRMMSYSKPDPGRRTMANLNQLIRDVLPILQHEIKQSGITLELCLEDPLPAVFVDSLQIQQVLVNLIRNAIDAMSQTAAGNRHLAIQSLPVADGVQIKVSDKGKGIDPAIADKLFQPFQSTKSHGLGLGLSISYRLIKEHGGQITAHPNPDQGVTFSVTLPSAKQELLT